MNKEVKDKGRRMSKLLRHDPQDLVMDDAGWVPVDKLLEKLKLEPIELDWIVENNNKKRFSYNQDETKIRANQGHSLNVKLEMDPFNRSDTKIVYHGTSPRFMSSIKENGILKGSRNHVHLSLDLDTAINVGSRKGPNPIVFQVNYAAMRADGVKVLISDNGVLLTEFVDPKYLLEVLV